MRTTYSGLVDEKLIGQTVTLYGWAHRRRDHGGVIFIDLRDREGLVQVVCDPDRPDVFATADKVRNEFCLAVVGVVRARPEGTKNEHLISGGVEVLCQKLEILNPSLPPPFQLDDDTVSESARLTYRVLDLRRQQMQRNLKLRFKVAQPSVISWTKTASSTSKRRSSPSPRPKAPAITSFPPARWTATSLLCRSRRSSSSNF